MLRKELREKLAELEHEQWMKWSKALAEAYTEVSMDNPDDRGTMISANMEARLGRWKRLWVPYAELSEEEKDKDREWADKALTMMKEYTEKEERRRELRREQREKRTTTVSFRSRVFPSKRYSREMLKELDWDWVSVNDRYWDRSVCDGLDGYGCPGEECEECNGAGVLEEEAERDRKRPINYDGHRMATAILITENDYLKDSDLSGNEVRKACGVRIFINGEQVYEYGTRDYKSALLTVQSKLQKIGTPWRWLEVGQKVKYDGRLMVCKSLIRDQGCAILETADGEPYETEGWFTENWVKVNLVETDKLKLIYGDETEARADRRRRRLTTLGREKEEVEDER